MHEKKLQLLKRKAARKIKARSREVWKGCAGTHLQRIAMTVAWGATRVNLLCNTRAGQDQQECECFLNLSWYLRLCCDASVVRVLTVLTMSLAIMPDRPSWKRRQDLASNWHMR